MDAKDIARAEKSAKYLLSLTESLAAVLPALAEVNGHGKIVRALEAKAEELKREEGHAKQRIDEANAAAAQILVAANAKTAEAERQAGVIVARANDDAYLAKQKIADAETRATGIVAAAKISSDALITEAGGRLEAIEGEIAAAAIRLSAVSGEADAAEARLADLNAEITRMKAKFG